MTKWKLLIPLSCLAVFHSPDGRELRIDTLHISAVRSAEGFKHHLAPGTNAVILVGSQNLGVVETPEEVESLMESCN
jgi:hypothetical protein